jgi:CYTH domain-containing protein
MGTEIERKFLITGKLPAGLEGSHIRQGYLLAQEGNTIRIRIAARSGQSTGYLTIKSPSSTSGISRFEFEKEIPAQEAERLLILCKQPLIEKIRYRYEYGGDIWEIDEFLGENTGLLIAEIELKSDDQTINKPDFIGKEVTGDIRYYNSVLQQKPFSQWSE